jgi:hypothetical protein
MFAAVNSVLSETMVTGRILVKFGMIWLRNQGCHLYIGGHEWWEEAHRVGEITSELG